MPITFTEGVYPYSTIVEDAHGNLHIFRGMHIPSNHPTLPKVLNNQADIFYQFEDDKEMTKGYLSEDEIMHLSLGYVIQTKHFPEDYFGE